MALPRRVVALLLLAQFSTAFRSAPATLRRTTPLVRSDGLTTIARAWRGGRQAGRQARSACQSPRWPPPLSGATNPRGGATVLHGFSGGGGRGSPKLPGGGPKLPDNLGQFLPLLLLLFFPATT
jgi:hypothetical protein